jgi:hypothetical protein
MDKETRAQIAEIRAAIGHIFDSFVFIQEQLDSIDIKQSAMLSVMERRTPMWRSQMREAEVSVRRIMHKDMLRLSKELRKSAALWKSLQHEEIIKDDRRKKKPNRP